MDDECAIAEHELVLSALDMLVSRLRKAEAKPPLTVVSTPLELGMTLSELEDRYILATLESVDGNKTRTADLLGIDRRTLYRKLSELAKRAERR